MEIELSNIKVIGFDADDTLWVNETYFREAEIEFAKLMARFETANKIDQELYKIELNNLPLYGYGVKGFILSMIQAALELSNGTVSNAVIKKILDIGTNMLNKPVELLDGVEQTLKTLNKKFKIILVTKGDLLDQERKLEKSKLAQYFHHIEILSDKLEDNYKNFLKGLDIQPSEFLMIGNSLKSDVIPLVNIGAQAIHIPFHTTWIHEEVKGHNESVQYKTISKLIDLIEIFQIENLREKV